MTEPELHFRADRPASAGARPPAEPHLLRFGLRQLLLFSAGLALLCMALKATSGAWPWIIGSVVLLVGSHVLGTLLGTRLRNSSPEIQRWRSVRHGTEDAPAIGATPVDLKSMTLPPVTPLAEQAVASPYGGWPVGIGMAAGALLGAAAIAVALGQEVTWPGLIVGSLSCGVLGAWLAFLGTRFATISRHAWRHAEAHTHAHNHFLPTAHTHAHAQAQATASATAAPTGRSPNSPRRGDSSERE